MKVTMTNLIEQVLIRNFSNFQFLTRRYRIWQCVWDRFCDKIACVETEVNEALCQEKG